MACAECMAVQFMTISGICCANLHGGVDSIPITTDRQRAEALCADMPFDTAMIRAFANRATTIEEDRTGGDGTLDLNAWKHVRNLAWALRNLAKTLEAMEENTDPDSVLIPF